MHYVFEIEEPLVSIFRNVHSLCLLWVNAVESGYDALCSSLFTFCVCSSCALYSLQCLDDPRVFNQCHFIISHLFAELKKTVTHTECERAHCEKMNGRRWAGGLHGSLLCILEGKLQEDTFHTNTGNFSSGVLKQHRTSWLQHILKSQLIFAALCSLLLQTF